MEPENLMPHQTQPAELSAMAELSEEALTEISAGAMLSHDEFTDKVDGPLVTDGPDPSQQLQDQLNWMLTENNRNW